MESSALRTAALHQRKVSGINDLTIKIGYSVSLRYNFTHHNSRACVVHSASEPFRLNGIYDVLLFLENQR